MLLLLSGKLPFLDNDETEFKNCTCEEPLDLESNQNTSELSDEARDLLQSMLHKSPFERI